MAGMIAAVAVVLYVIGALLYAFTLGWANGTKNTDSEASEIVLFSLFFPLTAAYVWGRVYGTKGATKEK